ncbi:hypothetical protein LCGC14_1000040 [marine sediment metagenome]|uniref:Uncharacterized protein n=1 Tax=marine sediment metagenome TaxID=412755 RepID=A0A0F9N3B2_9ZZZZ
MSWEEREILLIIKTYPIRSDKYVNTVCAAGILEDTNEWVRIYPISWLTFKNKNLKKFIRFKAEIMKNRSDKRKESYKIRENTIQIIDESLTNTKKKDVWLKRKQILNNYITDSLETLKESYKDDRTSLGMIKPNPETTEFIITKKVDEIDIDIDSSTQYTLTGQKLRKVDEIENVFKYKFKCNIPECSGHRIICEDWELYQAFRSWRQKYGTEQLEKNLKNKFIFKKNELYFMLGTHFRWSTWLIIGLFYPPKIREENAILKFI